MLQAPKPDNETARLETLRALKILDSDPEETFDRLARLATEIFNVPVSHVSLIDEHREWFKAKCGVEKQESERENAFCAHTILSDRLLVVEDTQRDDRFKDNPATRDYGIRFYAGAPLLTRSGLAVGAFCIKDYEPRTLSDKEKGILESLAAIVVKEMEHRLVEAELGKWENVFQRAEWGIAMANADNQTLDIINDRFAEMHGFTVEELQGQLISSIAAPEWRAEIDEHAKRVQELGRHTYECLHIRKDGSTFPVQVDAVAVRNQSGKLIYRAAHFLDITEIKQFERDLRFKNALLTTQQEASLDGILVVDEQGTVVLFNQRFVKLWGIPSHIMTTRRDDLALQWAVDQVADPRSFLDRVQYLYDHPDQTSSDEILLKDNRVFDRYSAPMRGTAGEAYGRVWYFRDVTDRMLAERSVRESEERLTRILETAMDAIVTVDENLIVSLFNGAAEDMFGCTGADVIGNPLNRFLSPQFLELLTGAIDAFKRSGARKRYMWSPAGLTAVRSNGETFPIECTISQTSVASGSLFTVILRDVNERQRAEDALRKLQAENVYLRETALTGIESGDIVGASAGIRRVLADVEKVAETDAMVLITGETGTGKELIARAIHDRSGRADKMLVCVNCAALPSGLIESELFGHERGAFTGAVAKKIGRFEMANGGTIFLDEIGDLPLELQSKLLRVLQEGEFERVGGTSTIRVDARIIAATNRDLEREVDEDRFRADLYYRLNVFPVRIPALRERIEDIPLLARHFALKLGEKMGKRVDTIAPDAVDALCTYHWPGNVRELRNVIERAVILSRGAMLELGQGPPMIPTPRSLQGAGLTLDDVERRHILDILERTGWRVSGDRGAAKILGLKRTTLEARMKRLGIKRDKN